MATVPATRLGKIEFYESHLAAWAANAQQIGLTDAQVLALQTLTMTATPIPDGEIKFAA